MDVDNEIKEIRKMAHNTLRDNRIYHLYQYLSYLLNSEQIDKEKYDSIKAMIGYNPPVKTPLISDCEDTLYLLTCIYEEILNNATKYNIIQLNSPHIEINQYIPYIIDFLKFMNVYDIYDDIKNSSLLSLSSNLKKYSLYGSTYNIGNGRSAIIVKNDNDFRTLITLVHEIGHAYENYLKKTFFIRKQQYFDSECLSTTFEYLFIQFLKNNNLVDEKILSISERNNIIIDLWRMDNAYVYNQYTFNQQIRLDNKDIKIPLEEFDSLSIIKVANYGLNRISPTCILKKYRNYYSYGLLFAMVMRERFIQNEQETKKFIQSFPKLLYDMKYNHLGRELLRLIPNNEYINATNNYIDKVLYKKC